MSALGGMILGAILVHLFYAAIFVGWWLLLIRRSGEDVQRTVVDDFAAVRAAIRRAQHAGRN